MGKSLKLAGPAKQGRAMRSSYKATKLSRRPIIRQHRPSSRLQRVRADRAQEALARKYPDWFDPAVIKQSPRQLTQCPCPPSITDAWKETLRETSAITAGLPLARAIVNDPEKPQLCQHHLTRLAYIIFLTHNTHHLDYPNLPIWLS